MMMPRRDPQEVDNPLPPLQQGVETKQGVEEGKVAVPLVPHAAAVLPVEEQSSVEGLVDPPKDQVPDVRLIRSAGNTLASEATQELKEAHVRDIFEVSATRGDA